MNMQLKAAFEERWAKYFPGAELPIVFFYAADPGNCERIAEPNAPHRCMVALLSKARKGQNIAIDEAAASCSGGKRYCGFSQALMPGFEYFLSCGIPDKLVGERYKKSPEIVREFMAAAPMAAAPASYIVFKRWDKLDEADEPEVAIFFARPDVLSGLFTLAGFEETARDAVSAPFGAGCATIIQYPLLEGRAEHPRCVLGMFDVSARPCVPEGVLTFAAPMKKFARMVNDMDESFLITPSWDAVRKRIRRSADAE
jgi:hypothetical protein